MIQFLFQGGHGPRAQALSNVTSASLAGDIATTKAVTTLKLDTLAVWGQGDSAKLCGKTPRDLHEVIKAWKKLNDGLKTIEIITCNSRHCTAGDPYAKKLKSGFGLRSSLHGITVKALPTSVGGKHNAWSILLAETVFKSWVYITAPGGDDKELMRAKTLIEYQFDATGRSISFKGDIAQRADETVRATPQRKWTMNYGRFATLRAHLGVVR